jgi:hypothetical protein
MGENFVTTRKVVTKERCCSTTLKVSLFIYAYIYIYIYLIHIKWTDVLREQNFFTNIPVLCNCNIYTKETSNSQMDFCVAKQYTSHNFVILYTNRWGVAQHISTESDPPWHRTNMYCMLKARDLALFCPKSDACLHAVSLRKIGELQLVLHLLQLDEA